MSGTILDHQDHARELKCKMGRDGLCLLQSRAMTLKTILKPFNGGGPRIQFEITNTYF